MTPCLANVTVTLHLYLTQSPEHHLELGY